jgi:prepilin-type N-terminal cleavage/methylation domain-containing protein
MRGFTLVEVIVALVVLQVAVLGVLGTTLTATRTMRLAEARTIRVRAAASVLDSLRADPGPGSGVTGVDVGRVTWVVDSMGRASVRSVTPDSVAFELFSVIELR